MISPSMRQHAEDAAEYEPFLLHFSRGIALNVPTSAQLFRTSASGLFQRYLLGIPQSIRQVYNCRYCQRFLDKFGDLAIIDEKGRVRSALFYPHISETFEDALGGMKLIVESSKVTGVFYPSEPLLGTPKTGEWRHLSAYFTQEHLRAFPLKSNEQMEAEKLEDFRILSSAVIDYTPAQVADSIRILRSGLLPDSERFLKMAEWLLPLVSKAPQPYNKLWVAVASAPAGYCHVKNTVLGTILDDIRACGSFDAVRCKYLSKINPLQYQRPQSAPTIGNIVVAEKIVEKLGIARSLERRYATLDEVQKIWVPERKTYSGSKVFQHLRKSNSTVRMSMPATTMTWDRFSKLILHSAVLPNAAKLEFFVPPLKIGYAAMTTATHLDAPPILQWDSVEARNPVSWYTYPEGTRASVWGLDCEWAEVVAVCNRPNMWQKEGQHHGEAVMLVLKGARDSIRGQGNGLFPSHLKAGLREASRTIEAYSKSAVLGIPVDNKQWVCGPMFTSDRVWEYCKLRVNETDTYIIDRWV